MLRQYIKEIIEKELAVVFGDIKIPAFSIEAPENPEHGDYATNAAMVLARSLKKPPLDIARELVGKISDVRFEKIEVVPPGFINIRLRDDALVPHMGGIDEKWGRSDVGKGKTVIVEYFQLNVAKPPHVGHLRSAVIGDALKRLFIACGYHAVSDSHIGDWGTQFGMLLLEFKKLPEDKKMVFITNISETAKAYAAASVLSEENPENRERAKEEFAKLERGDPENRKIWQGLVETTTNEFERSIKRLNLFPFDEHKGESSYEPDMPAIMEKALAKGVAVKKDDGAIIVDLTNEKLDEAVLIKSDGASTYLLRDLATIQYRKKAHAFWKNLYVVDVRQSHHFRQLFRVAELLGFEGVGESKHIEFGFMSLPEGAMSTRKGTTISLDAVLNEAEKRAAAAIEEKNPELKDKDTVIKMVALGAIKYFDLSHHRKSDIVFRWEDALAFEGNTGPYLQYTHARLKSILRKANTKPSVPDSAVLDPLEHVLLAAVLRFPDAIEDALEEYAPNILANYLYQLASRANGFYHSHPVLQEADENKKMLRLALVHAVAQTLKNGLGLLGIEAPEEM